MGAEADKRRTTPVRIEVFGAWLFELPFPLTEEVMAEWNADGHLKAARLVHMLPGEWRQEDLPRIRLDFKAYLPKVVDPTRYAIFVGLGDRLHGVRMSDIHLPPSAPARKEN